jgi:hypothetical protein
MSAIVGTWLVWLTGEGGVLFAKGRAAIGTFFVFPAGGDFTEWTRTTIAYYVANPPDVLTMLAVAAMLGGCGLFVYGLMQSLRQFLQLWLYVLICLVGMVLAFRGFIHFIDQKNTHVLKGIRMSTADLENLWNSRARRPP